MSPLRWSKRAEADLEEARAWFALAGSRVERAWLRRIRKRLSQLQRFPFSGQLVIPERAVRHVVIGNFRIFYRLDSDVIVILRLRDARRELLEPDEIGERPGIYRVAQAA